MGKFSTSLRISSFFWQASPTPKALYCDVTAKAVILPSVWPWSMLHFYTSNVISTHLLNKTHPRWLFTKVTQPWFFANRKRLLYQEQKTFIQRILSGLGACFQTEINEILQRLHAEISFSNATKHLKEEPKNDLQWDTKYSNSRSNTDLVYWKLLFIHWTKL